uniref:Uncharacterized protein n=1 Tax=Kalanchoe fedtschenkoi TaxID=63787 RepID=A0A7N0UB49_KALFE
MSRIDDMGKEKSRCLSCWEVLRKRGMLKIYFKRCFYFLSKMYNSKPHIVRKQRRVSHLFIPNYKENEILPINR